MTKKYKHSSWQDLGSVISGIIIAFFVALIFSVFLPLVLLRVFPPEKADCMGNSGWVLCGWFEQFTYLPHGIIIGVVAGLLSFLFITISLMKK